MEGNLLTAMAPILIGALIFVSCASIILYVGELRTTISCLAQSFRWGGAGVIVAVTAQSYIEANYTSIRIMIFLIALGLLALLEYGIWYIDPDKGTGREELEEESPSFAS